MTFRYERDPQETAFHVAIMDALSERVDQSPVTRRVDTRHLPDRAGYRYPRNADYTTRQRYKDGSRNIGPDDEDDDWRDIRACGDDPSQPLDPYVHFYDPETRIMYYIEDKRHQSTHPEATHAQDGLLLDNAPATEERVTTTEEPEMSRILSRLEPMDGQFGPRGYSAWSSKQLQMPGHIDSDIPGFASLCTPCHSILTHSLLVLQKQFEETSGRTGPRYMARHTYEIFSHHVTLAALHASARAGCHLCSLVLGPTTHKKDFLNKDDDCKTTYLLEISLFMTTKLSAMDRSSIRYVWRTWDKERNSSPSSSSSASSPTTLGCATTETAKIRELIRSWLSRCLREDEGLCSVATQFLPSRLIEIATDNGTLCSARLVFASELPPETQYLTLSHCWGDVNVKPVSLKRETFDKFRNDIPLSILSKTFRESLLITSSLGYRYLWIDSLCIIQDSDQDWVHEAARMGDIYRHSVCTIAATGAKDGNDGLFFERNALALVGCPLFAGKGVQMYATTNAPWPKPLTERAWAVQEKYLSSRMLSFGSDMVSWSCRRGEACEGPHAHKIQMQDHSFPKLLDGNTDEHTADAAWMKIVSEYSTCKLTYWKDKWPASQGLTAEVEKAQGWTIVHGLRAHQFGQDMLWYASDPEKEREAINCGEPSWSWLNIEGRVDWRSAEMKLDAEIVLQEPSARADARSAAQYPSERAVQIEACMTEFGTSSPGRDYRFMDCSLVVKNPKFNIGTSDGIQRRLDGVWCPDTSPLPRGDLRALQIHCVWERAKGPSTWKFEMIGLVITEVLGRPGYWRRVGMYGATQYYDLSELRLGLEDSDARTYASEPTSTLHRQADTEMSRCRCSGCWREIIGRRSSPARPALPVEQREDDHPPHLA
jgi:hypothetical protein